MGNCTSPRCKPRGCLQTVVLSTTEKGAVPPCTHRDRLLIYKQLLTHTLNITCLNLTCKVKVHYIYKCTNEKQKRNELWQKQQQPGNLESRAKSREQQTPKIRQHGQHTCVLTRCYDCVVKNPPT